MAVRRRVWCRRGRRGGDRRGAARLGTDRRGLRVGLGRRRRVDLGAPAAGWSLVPGRSGSRRRGRRTGPHAGRARRPRRRWRHRPPGPDCGRTVAVGHRGGGRRHPCGAGHADARRRLVRHPEARGSARHGRSGAGNPRGGPGRRRLDGLDRGPAGPAHEVALGSRGGHDGRWPARGAERLDRHERCRGGGGRGLVGRRATPGPARHARTCGGQRGRSLAGRRARLGLDVSPVGVRQADENLVLVRSRYVQPIGRFHGTLPGPDGEAVAVSLVGVTEDHEAVW